MSLSHSDMHCQCYELTNDCSFALEDSIISLWEFPLWYLYPAILLFSKSLWCSGPYAIAGKLAAIFSMSPAKYLGCRECLMLRF